jgi:hypothetical protein
MAPPSRSVREADGPRHRLTVLAQALSAVDAANGVQSARSGTPDDTDVAAAMHLVATVHEPSG